MKRSQEERLFQEPTRFNLGREGMFLRCPIISNQSFGSIFPAVSDPPTSPTSILTACNRLSVDSDEPSRDKRLKVTEVEKPHDDEVKVATTDAVVKPSLKIKIKLNPISEPIPTPIPKPIPKPKPERKSKPRPTPIPNPIPKPKPKRKSKPRPKPTEQGQPAPLSLPFFNASTSPEEIKAMLDSELDKMKSGLVSELKKIDESFACEVAAKIEVDPVKCNGDEKSVGDPFIMKKTLERSDIGNLSRLMLRKEWVKNHMFPFWGAEQRALVHSDSGLRVKIYDQDEQTVCALTLIRWDSNRCYIFKNKWIDLFVRRRNLQEGDTIGLYWDSFYSHFCFSVLDQKQPRPSPPPSSPSD